MKLAIQMSDIDSDATPKCRLKKRKRILYESNDEDLSSDDSRSQSALPLLPLPPPSLARSDQGTPSLLAWRKNLQHLCTLKAAAILKRRH